MFCFLKNSKKPPYIFEPSKIYEYIQICIQIYRNIEMYKYIK